MRQLGAADAERLKAVAEPARPARRRAAVPADVDRHAAGGLRIAHGVVEVEELAVKARPVRLVVPQQPHHLELFVGAAAAAAEIGAAGLDLLLQPTHPHAQPQPSAR